MRSRARCAPCISRAKNSRSKRWEWSSAVNNRPNCAMTLASAAASPGASTQARRSVCWAPASPSKPAPTALEGRAAPPGALSGPRRIISRKLPDCAWVRVPRIKASAWRSAADRLRGGKVLKCASTSTSSAGPPKARSALRAMVSTNGQSGLSRKKPTSSAAVAGAVRCVSRIHSTIFATKGSAAAA